MQAKQNRQNGQKAAENKIVLFTSGESARKKITFSIWIYHTHLRPLKYFFLASAVAVSPQTLL